MMRHEIQSALPSTSSKPVSCVHEPVVPAVVPVTCPKNRWPPASSPEPSTSHCVVGVPRAPVVPSASSWVQPASTRIIDAESQPRMATFP
ncbi:MAG: hypothetical protein M5U28_00075 [Sandaracinaceae bacterium]|nr:hypothetical protein [Sandaracinaceae bacterium]